MDLGHLLYACAHFYCGNLQRIEPRSGHNGCVYAYREALFLPASGRHRAFLRSQNSVQQQGVPFRYHRGAVRHHARIAGVCAVLWRDSEWCAPFVQAFRHIHSAVGVCQTCGGHLPLAHLVAHPEAKWREQHRHVGLRGCGRRFQPLHFQERFDQLPSAGGHQPDYDGGWRYLF